MTTARKNELPKNELPKNELTIIRMLDAPREKVWRACREPEALKQWWGLPSAFRFFRRR
jgi:uncharacterized protein YndB with AHSA1/START domain